MPDIKVSLKAVVEFDPHETGAMDEDDEDYEGYCELLEEAWEEDTKSNLPTGEGIETHIDVATRIEDEDG